jgi:hypothetical protein
VFSISTTKQAGHQDRLVLSPGISCSARNAESLERQLAVGLTVVMTLKAD